MFTGIVEATGTVESLKELKNYYQLVLKIPHKLSQTLALGDSLCVQGVCLTVMKQNNDIITMDLSPETLSCTTFEDFKIGERVNLERAVLPSTRLGGHLVSGHVDGIGIINRHRVLSDNTELSIQNPPELSRYIARKGSITVNGVSLTVNTVDENEFSVMLIPYTLQHTTFHQLMVNDKVNLEIDMIARYVERLLLASREEKNGS